MLIGGSSVVDVGMARPRRERRSAAKTGSGSSGVTGSRRASNGSMCGSGIAVHLVDVAELPSGTNQQGLGCGHGTAEDGGGLRNAEAIQIAQGQRSAVLGDKNGQHLMRTPAVQCHIPGVIEVGRQLLHRLEETLLAGLPAPVIRQLVSGYSDQPADGQRGTLVPLR